MPVETEDYTLGVEEEYQVIDPETRASAPAPRTCCVGRGEL